MNTDTIKKLKGIGEKTAGYFKNLGIETIDDLVRYYPVRFVCYEKISSISDIDSDKSVSVCGRLCSRVHTIRISRLKISECEIEDSTGAIKCVWYNAPYMASSLNSSAEYVFSGKAVIKRGRLTLEHPVIYSVSEYKKLEGYLRPVYGLTMGLRQNLVRKSVENALNLYDYDEDYLPHKLKEKYGLIDISTAIRNIHLGKSEEEIQKAHKRIVFDEFLAFLYSIKKLKEGNHSKNSGIKLDTDGIKEYFTARLPFSLTDSQKKCIDEILSDMSSGYHANRLIQGDVGSGKTVVALCAMYAAYKNKCQSVIMAPTEVLAMQHFKTFLKFFERFDDKPYIVLLTGSLKASEKKSVCEEIKSGKADIIIGTHAVISEHVEFGNLALVVTDEQHRFGVRQREMLSEKSKKAPHILVMSATPIPRTLAVILYGDLDISVIDTKPLGRLPVKNAVIGVKKRKTAYDFIEKEIKKGHQAYVICPMIDQSDEIDAENVQDYTEKLRSVFPNDIVIQCLHGRMKPVEKEEVMRNFSAGDIDVLVSTTVIEVGVDVANATVMLIENAERFGLAALHQLRGRVGRGEQQSYCIFVRTSDSDISKQRLDVIGGSNDGFYISSEDLRLRGPGEILGVNQSGQMRFRLGDVYTDYDVLMMAQDCNSFIDTDQFRPDDLEMILFKKHMEDYRDKTLNEINI